MKPDGILWPSLFRPPSSSLRRTLRFCPLGDAIPCICFCSHEAPSCSMLPVDAKWAAHFDMLYLGVYYFRVFCFPVWMAALGTSPVNHRGKASPSKQIFAIVGFTRIIFPSQACQLFSLLFVWCVASFLFSRTSSLLI